MSCPEKQKAVRSLRVKAAFVLGGLFAAGMIIMLIVQEQDIRVLGLVLSLSSSLSYLIYRIATKTIDNDRK